ncbi:acid-soluble spore protein N [Halalkalibacter alkaliphilus]|uniref:Acid-soluble spore protein N n=1 Tax=Halalkalibacter alkaliphilus TaxID=2917993 RepID=A0A9X2CSE2_9BACI|nr:acid-soluble spore protein N [Halalkalibacter alkaliphilus]MCL7747386.1 acid-soluble spore protein N [Halalkalibacter alkaliphilus]
MKSTKSNFAQYRPDHLGTQPVKSKANNGKKMAQKSNEQPNYVPPKG